MSQCGKFEINVLVDRQGASEDACLLYTSDAADE